MSEDGVDGHEQFTFERLLMTGMAAHADDTGQSLRTIRNTFGVSQADLANYLDVSPSVVSDYENGRRENPGPDYTARFVNGVIAVGLLGAEPDEFTGDNGTFEDVRRGLPENVKAILDEYDPDDGEVVVTDESRSYIP